LTEDEYNERIEITEQSYNHLLKYAKETNREITTGRDETGQFYAASISWDEYGKKISQNRIQELRDDKNFTDKLQTFNEAQRALKNGNSASRLSDETTLGNF
jgi:hypothetical protein